MMEIRNGKTKRMIGLLAQDSTLSLLQAMRGGSWLAVAELEQAVRLEPEVLVCRLEGLVSLGVLSTREDEVRRWKLVQPRISFEVDLRELPPGPGYVLDIVRFYVRLLSNLLGRCREVGGRGLQAAVYDVITQVRLSVTDRERALLSCLRDGTDFGPCLRALENRILSGELQDNDLDRVRATYLAALTAVAERIKCLVDDSQGKLIFRLAARELLREGADLAERFALLEGIPQTYLKQVERTVASY